MFNKYLIKKLEKSTLEKWLSGSGKASVYLLSIKLHQQVDKMVHISIFTRVFSQRIKKMGWVSNGIKIEYLLDSLLITHISPTQMPFSYIITAISM
jgi:hypothetical protein